MIQAKCETCGRWAWTRVETLLRLGGTWDRFRLEATGYKCKKHRPDTRPKKKAKEVPVKAKAGPPIEQKRRKR